MNNKEEEEQEQENDEKIIKDHKFTSSPRLQLFFPSDEP